MKVAISIPDRLHRDADAAAERIGISRSGLYARALERFLAEQDADSITAAINAALADIDQEEDLPFIREAARQTFLRTEW